MPRCQKISISQWFVFEVTQSAKSNSKEEIYSSLGFSRFCSQQLSVPFLLFLSDLTFQDENWPIFIILCWPWSAPQKMDHFWEKKLVRTKHCLLKQSVYWTGPSVNCFYLNEKCFAKDGLIKLSLKFGGKFFLKHTH
jgi:hypothetical protein